MKFIVKKIIKMILAKYLAFKTNSVIKASCSLNLNSSIEGHNVINSYVIFTNSKLGYGSYIGERSSLNNTLIGKYCSIAENVKIIFGSHPTKTFVSTHPAFFSTRKQAGFSYVNNDLYEENKYSRENKNYSVTIGNDVWIGAHVKILEGITIGDGVVVATGAVVVKDLEPYGIYGGVPAKKIGERFTDEEKNFLLEFKWWNHDKDWIEKNASFFSDIEKFKEINSK